MSEQTPRNTILIGDAGQQLATLPPASVDCVITSPPYFNLRDYGMAGQLGMEPTIQAWVANLRSVFREVARVLAPSGGGLWLNLGDSFSRHPKYGAQAKSLMLAPERLLLALAEDGWIVRNKVVWAKSNPLPSSVTDRLNLTYEPVYFLVRSHRYFYDLDAVRVPHQTTGNGRGRQLLEDKPTWAGPLAAVRNGLCSGLGRHARGKNPGDVWTIPTRGFRGAHFATFPPELVRRPLLASCPLRVCTACGLGWKSTDLRWGCDHETPPRPGLVLDPFFGTGTVGKVAQDLGRDWLGIEINPAYAQIARERLGLVPEPTGEPTP